MITLGIDPGIGRVGWGVIRDEPGKQSALDFGCFETSSKLNLEERLAKIHNFIVELIKKFNPEAMAIEQLYFAANSKTALIVGHARGVILLAAADTHLPATSYTPLQVKLALTGYGRAEKKQVQVMVSSVLHLQEPLIQDDAADALAVALTHAFSYKLGRISK